MASPSTLRFVLGRAGAGKTYHCLEAIRARLRESPEGHPLLLLVPDQATFQMERALAETPDLGGYIRAHVLSFRRLAHRLVQEVGGASAPPVGGVRRLLLLKAVLGRLEGSLEYYRRAAAKMGFVRSVDAALAEWRRYGVTPDEMDSRARGLKDREGSGNALALKLADLARIERAYREALGGNRTDPEDYLQGFEEKMARSAQWQDAAVWVDGFASFTAQERRALFALIRRSRATDLALCLDPRGLERGVPSEEGLRPFSTCEQSYWRLRGLAQETGVALAPDLELDPPLEESRFARAPSLSTIEAGFFSQRPEYPRSLDDDALRIVCASTPAGEADYVARETLRLARDEGFRFSEIGIILRSLEGRHDLLTSALGRLGIPFFLDRKREVSRHPLAELLSSAAWIVCRGWRSGDVLQALKTDLLPLSRDEADRLENHALSLGMEGREWLEAERWSEGQHTEPAQGERPLAEIARVALKPLVRLEGRCRGQEGRSFVAAHEFGSALSEFLAETGAPKAVEQWSGVAGLEGDPEKAAEHRQAGELIEALLQEWTEGLGETRLPLRECAGLLEEGLASLQLGLAPPTLDHVLIGSIERSRHPELRVVFVLGMNEKTFPMASAEDPILGDADRARLAVEGLELGPRASERLLNEPFLAYIAMTRPRERLILTFAARDEASRPLAPSPYLGRVTALLPHVAIERLESARSEDMERIHDVDSLGAMVANALRGAKSRGQDPAPDWLALTALGRDREGEAGGFNRRLGGLFYRNEPELTREAASALYADKDAFSATRLESMASCPFQCFAKNGLALQERALFRLEAVDRGQLFHRALAGVFNHMRDARKTWANVDPATLENWVDREIDFQAGSLRGGLLRQTGKGRFLLEAFRRELRERCRALCEEFKAGQFRQEMAEARFGYPDSPFPALRIDLGQGRLLRLHGSIDRIDIGPGTAKRIRVIDYKTSGMPLSPALTRHGIHLQLPAYLLAATEVGTGRGWSPGGFFYSPVRAKLEKASPGEEAGDEDAVPEIRAYRSEGLFDSALIEAMDGSLAEKGASRFWRMARKQDGSYSDAEGRSDAVSAGDLLLVLEHTRATMADLGRAMLGGDVAVAPYRCGQNTACGLCAFRSVCRFEEGLQPWREIANESRADSFQLMCERLERRDA